MRPEDLEVVVQQTGRFAAQPDGVDLHGLAVGRQRSDERPVRLAGEIRQDRHAETGAAHGERLWNVQAMPADVVRKIMGAPRVVKPMKTPEGKAEIWSTSV